MWVEGYRRRIMPPSQLPLTRPVSRGRAGSGRPRSSVVGRAAAAPVFERLEERIAFAISPVVTETGLISLSLDALGTNAASNVIRVQKPAGATVRAAYLTSSKSATSSVAPVGADLKINGANP